MRIIFSALSCFVLLSAQSQNLISGGQLKPLQAIMDIRHYTVALDADPVQQTIGGTTDIDLILSKPTDTLLFNLVDLYKVSKVLVNGKPQSFDHHDHLLYIISKSPFAAQKTTVSISYSGKPAVAARPPWDGGFTWSKDTAGNPWIAVTDEGEGATILFPCKDHPSDEPNEGADMLITVPKGLTAVGPGLLQGSKTKGNKTTWHWKTRYTINNYSILFNVGKYKLVSRPYTTINGNKVPMDFYVLESNVAKAEHHLDVLERSIRVQEKYFGEYPFVKEKIGICETPHLGMEHQTMNAYGNNFKYTKVGGNDFDWLMHHEFGHEWWANKITNKDWAHYWIQEGICVFGDMMFIREVEGEEAYLKKMRSNMRGFQNQKPVVMGETVTEDEAYHPDIYNKGAFFMHSLRFIIGDSIFFPALKGFATDPRFTYDNMVTTDDVEKYFSQAAGRNLKPFFDFFLRTVNKLEIQVRQTGESKYQVKSLNLDMTVPLQVTTDKGVNTIQLDKKGVTVNSESMPLIDVKGYYLKKVIYE
jgi:aminopeptidase N